MKKGHKKGYIWIGICGAMVLFLLSLIKTKTFAANGSSNIKGRLFEFEDKNNYNYSMTSETKEITGVGQLGTLSINGNIKTMASKNGYEAFEVKDGVVCISYDLNKSLLNAEETEWHLYNDGTTEINSIKLDNKVQKGAIIVQTSVNGKIWVTDTVITNIVGAKSEFASSFYNTRGIQQVNGCYYRIIVAYKLEKRLADTKVAFITQKHYDYKKFAEVYEFYLIDSYENTSGATKPEKTPKKELGKKIKTGKDTGFSGEEAITNKDPHFGWDIGTFYLNGFTREEIEVGTNDPVFLKYLGDRVTLWFTLNEDITKLRDNKNLSISEDYNGYDQYFGVPQTNFKHGTLIIKYTDYEGKAHDPIIYTDFLAANALTNENTKVELFEEGDYEVALDYEIKDTSGLLDVYTNYRIFFKFKIRNANCMVFPFDIKTNAELSDKALTENGFRLDLAKSRYLKIDIVREAVKNENGRYILDARVSTATQEGKDYTTEGIYTFTVKNRYTDTSVTKTIYVGDQPIYKALASGISLENINELLDQGGELQEDGTILMPVLVVDGPDENETKETNESTQVTTEKQTIKENETNENTKEPTLREDENKDNDVEDASIKNEKSTIGSVIFIVIGLVAAGLCITGFVFWKRVRGDKKLLPSNELNDEEEEGQ